MHDQLRGGSAASIARLLTLTSIVVLAACGGESAFMAHGMGGEGANPGIGGDLGTGGDDTGSGGTMAPSGTGGAASGGTTGSGGSTPGTGGMAVSGVGGAGTGGRGTGGTGTGGAGTGGRGTGGAAGSGPGVVVLTVPFTAGNTGSFFNGPFTTMPLDGHTATFSLCVSTGTANPSLYSFQAFATDSSNGMGSYGSNAAFTQVTTCPTMTPFVLAISGTTPVNAIGLHIMSAATDAAAFGPAALEIDSISISGDPVGPFQYMSDVQGFVVNSYQVVTGSTATWQSFP